MEIKAVEESLSWILWFFMNLIVENGIHWNFMNKFLFIFIKYNGIRNFYNLVYKLSTSWF